MKSKKLKAVIAVLIVLIIVLGIVIRATNQTKTELRSIKSMKELERRYGGSYRDNSGVEAVAFVLGMPFSPLISGMSLRTGYYSKAYNDRITNEMMLDTDTTGTISFNDIMKNANTAVAESASETGSSSKDYSTTNIQVENVDEADIIKTDGDYIYSISDINVIITDARDLENPKIAAKVAQPSGVPEDLIIYKDKLVVISAEIQNGTYYYNYNSNTRVNIYDISNKENPLLIKTYTLYEPYYTSRCIDNRLYVISSGALRKDGDKIITYYSEDRSQKEIELENIKYLTDIDTNRQTLISFMDLNNTNQDIVVNSYLIDVSNAYVSEEYIYLLNQKYQGGYRSGVPPVSSLFSLKGAFGPFDWENDYDGEGYGYYTDIYKFDITNNGEIAYKAKANVKGQTINQYSIDEYEKNLRVALYNNQDGSRVVIFDENLKQIGASDYLAKGENMYSSRFIGNKAYLVTYQTVDPLFVIDLSDVTKPKVLGELKIPGYSTYLHPYDENHLIGIGMETKETVNRDAYGKVTRTTASIIGMKMALFDVSDVQNPKELSNIVIGDSRTRSSILTNPKALLFSKAKELIAIPVNNYSEDLNIENTTSISSSVNSYINQSKNYISEGYLVYSINTEDGFNLKGTVTHENAKKTNGYNYGYESKLLRGLYIEDDLFTVSENEVKVNRLETMEEIADMKIKEG